VAVYEDYIEGKAANLFLDFYANLENASSSKEIIYARREDQEAYDAWHLAWYVSEILDIHELSKSHKLIFNDIPRKEKNLIVYLLLLTFERPVALLEFGCAMFELIDGIEISEKILTGVETNEKDKIVEQTEFFSIEMSKVMRGGAERLHPNIPIRFFNHVNDLDRNFDLIYDRNVSSYAMNTVDDLVSFMSRGEVGFYNLFVSKDKTFISMRMGKSLTYFHLEELVDRLDKPLYYLFGQKSLGSGTMDFDPSLGHDVIEGFFLNADEAFAQSWLVVAMSYPDVAKWFVEKEIKLTLANALWSI